MAATHFQERIVYNNVQNTAAGNGPVYNGAYTEHFVSGGYRLLSHSEYAYSNGEIRVNQYWTKETSLFSSPKIGFFQRTIIFLRFH